MTFMGYARNCVQTYAFDYVHSFGDICTGLCDSLVANIYTRLPVVTKSNRHPDKTDTNATPPGKGLTDRPRDEARRIHELLRAEYVQVEREYRHLRGIVDQLTREYEVSKDVDCIRRYGLLKRMIKRTIVHLKLELDDSSMSLFSLSKHKEDFKQRETRHSSLSTQELCAENDEIREQIKEHRRKVTLIRDLIQRMEASYDGAKHQFVLRRYSLMKDMVKTVICNRWI